MRLVQADSLKKNLINAKRNKNDEFYTQLPDIEREMHHYRHHFKNKVVYCNCDDPRESQFFNYFALNFEFLGLKKLITTCYKSQDVDLFSQGDSERAIYLEYTGERDGGKVPTVESIGIHELEGDGDFRSEEAIELLKEADIVVTNPPFSLFREYITQLIEYDKKFIVIGSKNALTYKEIFPLIRDNKMWMGYGFKGGNAYFKTPIRREFAKGVYNEETGLVKFRNVTWYTNLDIPKRHEDMILYKRYNPEEYPKYDNYNAINVDRTAEIPMDYDGVMGVPITFLEKYNPNQFEILGMAKTPICDDNAEIARPIKRYENAKQHNQQGKVTSGNKVNDAAAIRVDEKPKKGVYYTADGVDGYLVVPYARVLIRNKRVVKT